MAVCRGLKVYLSLLGRAFFHHIGLGEEIIFEYHTRRFRYIEYNLCILLLYFGSVKFSREKPPTLYKVPYH